MVVSVERAAGWVVLMSSNSADISGVNWNTAPAFRSCLIFTVFCFKSGAQAEICSLRPKKLRSSPMFSGCLKRRMADRRAGSPSIFVSPSDVSIRNPANFTHFPYFSFDLEKVRPCSLARSGIWYHGLGFPALFFPQVVDWAEPCSSVVVAFCLALVAV